MTLDFSGETRARHDLRLRWSGAAGTCRTLRNERDADPLLLKVYAQDLECPVIPAATRVGQLSDRPVGANVEACANASTPGSSSTNAPNSVRHATRPVRTWPISYVSWTRDLLLVIVNAQDVRSN